MIDGRGGTSAMEAGRTGGNGAADVGGSVCGGVILPVISALSRVRRSLILANWLCADLFAASTLAFRLATSLERRAIDCCAALLSSRPATSTEAGLENPLVIAAPVSTPKAAAIATEAASTMWRLWRGRIRSCSHRAPVGDARAMLVSSSLISTSDSLTAGAVSRVTGSSPAGSLVTVDVIGEIEGEWTTGSSICSCCGALSEFANGSPSVVSVCLRLVMALVLDWTFTNR